MTDLINITNSTEISETGGNYPQVEGMPKGYAYDAENSIYNIAELERNNNYEPDIQDFIIKKSTRLTDFLSFNNDFFIISDRVSRLLKNFRLPPNRQFNCNVLQGDQRYPYVVLFFFKDIYDYTDYGRSAFTMRFFEKEEKRATVFNTKANFNKELGQAY